MRDDELKNLVDELLYLVEVGSGSPEADEAELAHLLDRLALAVRHGVDPGEPEPAPEVPPRDVAVLEKVAASRFPGFADYRRPVSLTAAETAPRSAVRDVAAVADALHVVAWLWRNHDWDAGLGYLHASHRRHWGEAMRSLQLYLHLRENERERWRESQHAGQRDGPARPRGDA